MHLLERLDEPLEHDVLGLGRRRRQPGDGFDDGGPGPLTPAPEHGADTEQVLLEMGMDWAKIGRLKESGAII